MFCRPTGVDPSRPGWPVSTERDRVPPDEVDSPINTGVVVVLSSAALPQRTTWEGEPTAQALGGVRWGVRRVLEHWQVDEAVIDEAVSVVDELVGNVVQHARTPWRLAVELRGRMLHIAVDDGRVGPGPWSGKRAAGQVSGLRLVSALALRWGWDEHEAGKTVWADLLAW